jgi:hypothetical protein
MNFHVSALAGPSSGFLHKNVDGWISANSVLQFSFFVWGLVSYVIIIIIIIIIMKYVKLHEVLYYFSGVHKFHAPFRHVEYILHGGV